MLAPNFLSAADLGIDPEVRDALIQVLHLFETEELVHVLDPTETVRPIEGKLFSMNEWATHFPCGTVRCIGGWAETFMPHCPLDADGDPLWQYTKELEDLFYPPLGAHPSHYGSTPKQAAMALRNYLTTGSAQWETVS